MDAPALSPAEARELAALRLRAYGPAPDIRPDEIVRLERLESVVRPPAPPSEIGVEPEQHAPRTPSSSMFGSDAASAPVIPANDDSDADDSDADDSDTGPDEAGPAAPQVAPPDRRGMGRWWVVAVAAGLVVVVIVWGVLQMTGPRATATLDAIPDEGAGRGGVQLGMLGAYGVDMSTIRQYESYHALSTWVASSSNGDRCLVIYAGAYGPAGVSCTPRGLEPTVDVRIYDGMPDEIVGGLPPGSVIRYVLAGDRVLVWERSPDIDL